MQALTAVGRACSYVGRALNSNVEELWIGAGVILVSVGMRDVWAPGAYIIPGLVILWIWLPARAPFVVRATEDKKGRT